MKTIYSIGIDFGTSNSCVSYATFYEQGGGEVDPDPLQKPEVIQFDLKATVPTVVFVGNGRDQPPAFGEVAEDKAPFYPEYTRSGFKLRLGRPDTGREAFLLTKQFLGYLRKRVAEVVPLDKRLSSARFETTVGHPVQWSPDQREETRRAAIEAGFPNVRLEEESMAALYSHLCDDREAFQPRPGSRLLMVDMGGGTTDFAFVQLAMNQTQRPVSIPVDPSGSVPGWGDQRRTYGGRDLDELMLRYLTRDWSENEVKKNRQGLLREVRRFKEAFSRRVLQGEIDHEALWLVGDDARTMRLTRAEFEEFAREYIAHFQVLLRGALDEARLAPRQVTHLILTGGHSAWYFVIDALREVFPHLSVAERTVLRHPCPEQSVARGLAYVPLVRASKSGVMAPARRAAHAIWLSIPNGALAGAARNGGWDEPVLLLPRGQQLPFQTRKPLRICVEQLGLDAREATVSIRFFSGQRRMPLAERVATFDRGVWEQLGKRLSHIFPWMRGGNPDQFEVLVACKVDEHELITAELLVTRMLGGKPLEVQRQTMKLNSAAA